MACSICNDRGIILEGDVAVQCGCAKIRNLERLFKESHLPRNLLSCTFENFDFKYYAKNSFDPVKGISYYDLAVLAYEAARNFVKQFLSDPFTDGLLFTGQVGSGKTYLACCIANELIRKGQLLLFSVVPDLLDQIRATYDSWKNNEDVTESEIVETARRVPLLILDDLGAHNYTEWTRNKIYSIINYRLNHRLPVIATTNISLEDLEEYLGERTTSRIFEMCKPYRLLVEMDIRAVQRKEKDLKTRSSAI
jgi:DNA replication protein DnaC